MDAHLKQIADDYRRWLDSWARPKTRDARATLARSRLRAWGHPDEWDAETIQRFLTWNAKKGERRPEWTQATYLAHLRDFGAWCVANEVTQRDPITAVKKSSRPTSLPRPLSESEIPVVLAAASERQRAWILLALHAGLRAHEVAKIRGEDVSDHSLYVEGKRGKRASLPLHPDLAELASKYPKRGYWFPSGDRHVTAEQVSGSISKLLSAHGIDGSIHRFRHSYGTRLVRAGVDLRRVQTLMRHSSLATTEVYTAVEDDGLRDAINLLPSA